MASAPSFSSSAIVAGLRSAPTAARNTPSAQRSGVRPSLSLTSSRAPRFTSSSMMSFEPRFAAPSSAVSPIELVAFTSAPSSRHSFTASSRACSDSV